MKPISTTDLPPLSFSLTQERQPFYSNVNKIGWMRTLTDKPGASFDITIRDGMGRVRVEKKNCTSETEEFGELVNIPTNLGENLEIEVSNLKGAESLTLFLD